MNKIPFQKYPNYKASGVEWLGEIPETGLYRFKNDVIGSKRTKSYARRKECTPIEIF